MNKLAIFTLGVTLLLASPAHAERQHLLTFAQMRFQLCVLDFTPIWGLRRARLACALAHGVRIR